jgi:hypothetical protein
MGATLSTYGPDLLARAQCLTNMVNMVNMVNMHFQLKNELSRPSKMLHLANMVPLL